MNLKKTVRAAIMGMVLIPAIASAKPPADRHVPKAAIKANFAKLRFHR